MTEKAIKSEQTENTEMEVATDKIEIMKKTEGLETTKTKEIT